MPKFRPSVKLASILILVLALGACVKNAPSPNPPPTPTSSVAKSLAILSGANLATARDTVNAMNSNLLSKADGAKILSLDAQIDTACYESAQVLKSGGTPAQIYTQLSAKIAALVIPQFVDAKAQAEVSALAASVALVVASIQEFAH